jgi:2-hydroxycyclohexanecarboxyl-CoA dehydrogenase
MDMKLKGQGVAVVGAARGIGAAIAAGFTAEGCVVHGFDREEGDSGLPMTLGDVTDYEALRAFAAGCGAVQHLVFCVGVGSGKFGFPFWNLQPGDWGRVVEVNLLGAVHAAHAFAPVMIPHGEGSMLFLTSVAGQMGSQTDPPYSAAKAALINFTQCAAKDLAPYGLRANALAPGMVQTSLNRSVWAAAMEKLPATERMDYESWGQEKVGRLAPLGRWQEPEEFAAMAVYLASPYARNITGQTLNVDGGQVMHS